MTCLLSKEVMEDRECCRRLDDNVGLLMENDEYQKWSATTSLFNWNAFLYTVKLEGELVACFTEESLIFIRLSMSSHLGLAVCWS